MAKASPARTSFNAGEFSRLVEGRTDIDRYPASMRKMVNFIAVPQGPALRRSGTAFACEVRDSAYRSHLVPFIFNENQSLQLEFANEELRFILEEGLQVFTERVITDVPQTNPMKIDSATLDALVGDEVALSGFDPEDNMNGRVVTITAKVGTVYTLDIAYPGVTGAPVATARASLVYSIDSPYESDDVQNIRSLQSVDVVYLFCEGYRPRKLSRYASYDWRLTVMEFNTGPFMPVEKAMGSLLLSGTGNPTTGGTATASGGTASAAFDGNTTTVWNSGTSQGGWVQYQYPVAKVINAYVVYMSRDNSDATYSTLDFAPGDFNFMGSNNGTTWFLLDAQRSYVLYDDGRSVLFEFNNNTAYLYYRFEVTACTRNGPITTRIGELLFRDKAASDITLTLSGLYDDVNNGSGFLATDVDRLLRLKGSDQFWRILRIKTWVSATSVVATLLTEPFISLDAILEWQLGYWSDTTGWPACGTFFEDRMFVGGTANAPDLIAGSRTGAYENFEQRTPANEVLDDSAVVVRLNSRRLSGIRWLNTDERGLLVGTGTNEWVVSPSNTETAFSARNIKARSSTDRGSASIEPVKVDRQILYIQASRRTVREYAYVFEADGYKSPSMSLFASHMGVPRFSQMAYASEPHSIIWFRKENGSVVGLTYNREENVIGWHTHDFGGEVESISVIPSVATSHDTLWIIVRREIDGETRRYIERLMPFWDFDSTIEQAHFVDCGLKYEGDPATEIYGLVHLEGRTVCGLRDGIPFDNVTIVNGKLELPDAASVVTVGLQFVSEAEISRIEAGAADGTAQGKEKRIHNLVAFLWQSAYGEFSTYNENQKIYEWQDVPYDEPYDELQPINLQDGMFGPMIMPQGYNKRGSVGFRQTMPLPFNVISLLPQMHTQDR